MSKLFKRLMCLLLGIVIGISATVGSIATSVYYLYGNVTVTDILPDDKDRLKDMLGDLGNYSAEDIVALFSKAIKAPENYTIADLERDYGLNLVDLINQIAGKNIIDTDDPDNKPYIDDLKSISLFALLSGQTDFKAFLSDVPLGAVLSFIPAGTILDKEQREKLRKYSVGSLLAADENTDLPVALSALSDLTVGGVYTNMFEKDGDEYRAKEGQSQALNLVANIKLGGLLSPLTGKTTFGDELVGGGLSSIGALTLGDLYRKIGGENSEELAGRLDGFLTDADGNPVKIRDLFAKDISDGNDHYRFVLDKLLDSIKLGTFIGFSRKDGKWVATDGAGNDTEVTGLLSFLADLNITDLYHALTDSGSTSDRIHRIILVFGDLTVGHVFETLGCKRDESGKWIKSDGTEFKSKLAEKLLDFSVRDIFGDEDQELTGTQVRLNIIGAVSELCGDMTLGEGIGELFGVESAREGENVVYTKDGTRVNPALGRLFDIKLRDIVNAFGGEKIDLSEVKGVFETAVAGVYLGDMLGGEKVDGVWYKGGEKVSDALSLIYEISFNGVFSLLNELNSDNFSYSEIIRGFMPETALGDIFAIFSGIKKTGVGDDAYFVNADGTPLPKGINSFLTIRLWQYASAFDPNGRYDLNVDLSDVRLGDVVSLVWKDLRDDCVRGEYENVWGTNKENGNLPLILSDVFNVDIASIINVATAKETINAEICKLLNAFTDSDNHTLGMYLDDLLKGDESESIIKKNVGVYGMLNIKIAELVSVILKEKTGLSANPDGSITKLKAESLLPSNYKDLLIYVFDNITDKVLIGDFLRNSDGSGYTYKVNTEGKLVWYDKEGKVCPVETSEVLSLPSTYIFFLIGGAVGFITGSEEFMNGLNSYQIGVILEPLYNSALADYDSKMTSVKNPDGDDYIYTARGVYELIATKLANKTFKGFCDELKSDALKVLFDRELGDYLFDTFSLILGLGDYAGIHGFASDNKDKDLFADKYKSEKVAATAILNFNVYEFIKANDKKAYLKEAFKEVTFGDVLELTNLVVGKETSYNGRTIKAYSVPGNASTLDEGGADGNTTDKPIGYGWSGLLNTNIVNFVKALSDHKPFLEIINGGDEGDIVDVNFEVRDYIALLKVFGVEYNDEFDYEPANRLLDINVKTFLTTLLDKEKSNEEKIEYVVNIFGDLTVYDFIEFNDTLKNTDLLILKDHIYPIVVSEFIIELIEAKGTDAKLSVIKKYFGEISVGDIINIIDRTFTYLNQRRSVRRGAITVYAAPNINKVWVRGETKLKLILSDIFNVTISNIFDIVEAAKSGVIEAIGTAAEIMFPRICEVYLNDFGIEVSSDSIFKNVKIAELGKLIREILNDPKTALKKYFGDAALGEFVNAFYSDFGRDEHSKVWGIGGKSLFLILSDLLDITVNNIIDTIDIFTKETVAKGVCEVLNIITKKDAHTLGAYLDDLLKGDKSESVIKQNVGLNGITNIRIAELVAVILKEKTGIEADKGGTLDKFGVVNSLPEDFRDLIVYICNITDKVLIGDYLRKSDNSGYTYTEGADGKKTWKNASGEACTEIISEILSLPTTYPFVIIGGIAYVISDPNGALEMLKPYKVGVVLEPIYNAAFGGFDSSKMTHLGDEKTGAYTIAGVYKAFLEELANKTFGEVMDDIKADSQCVVKYLIDRELGDLVYDLLTKIVKFGDKIGIDGLASENKTAKGYVSKKNAISAILNFNIYKLIKAEDKVGYLKEAFGNVTLGDLAEIYDKITKEEVLYNGRKVNEYKLDGKTFGLGVSGLLSTEIVGLIDAFTKKDGKLLDRIEAVVDIDFMIGDYLTVMDVLGISYNGTAWIKNEKEIYAPLNNVLKVNVKEFVNTLTGDKSAEEKRDYIIRIFDKLTVKDFVSISDNLANLDKILLQKHIYPIVVADVIIDFITETDKLGVAKKYFGEITIGSIANLAINVTEDGGVWSDGKGEMKLIVTDVFNITVNDILGIIETIKNGGDLEAIVKQVAEVVFNERSLKEYLADLKNDKVNKIIEKEALQKLITSKIVEVVAKVFEKIGEKDYAGIITYYFDETSVGEFAQIFMDGLKKDGEVWANNGTAMKLIVSDVFDVNVDNIVEIVKSFKNVKAGVNKTAEIILKRTFQEYVKDFGYDLSKKDAFAGIRDVVVSDFVAAMLENDRLDSLKTYFKDARLGDVVNVANDKFAKNETDVWANNGKAVKLILSDVFDVNVDNIVEIVKAFKNVKDGINKTAEIILKRTFQAYVKDFGYDLSKKDAFAGIRDVVVSEFVAAMLENDRLDSLKNYFKDARLGDVVNVVNDKFAKNGDVWANNGKAVKLILSDILDVDVDNIVEIVKSFKYIKDGINKTAEIILKRTFQEYVKDFGYDLSEKDLFEKIRVVKVSDFVAEMLEDTRLDRLKYYFGEASVGNILELFLKIERDAEGWKKKGGDYYAVMIGDVFDINVNKVIDIKNKLQKGGDNVIAEVFNDIFPERRVGDLVNVVIPKLSDECVRGEYTNVWGMTKEKGELPLILSDVFNLRIKTILDAVLGGKEVTDIVLSITDEIFGNRITDEQDVWARTFNEYMLDLGITYVNEHDAFRKIREERVGEFIYHVLKDGDKTIDYLRGLVNDITLRNIAELALDGATIDKLPLIVRDVFDVAIGNIIDVATAGGKIKTEICNVLNVITKKDAHTLGAYLDDLLKGDKSESVIKQNVGLNGITNIRIAELVAVILKEKTGIEADKGGTLDKFGVVNSLPEDFRDLIVYICNITDKVLIGDYLRKSDNSGYTYTEDADGKKTWKNASGEACTEILSEILSLPTTYPFVIIGGIAYVISDPNGALEMLKPYKVGVVLEPIYNAAFGGFDSSKMSHLGDEKTGAYIIAGVYKAFLEELANKTFGEVMDDIKADSQCVVKYLIDRELGDLVYDLLTKIVKFGDKIGIDGLASENKTAKGYVSKKNAISAILNFNIYKLIKAEDKAEYLKGAFGSVTIGDLAEIYDKITKEEALYNGRKVNEYKLDGKTFGLGISGLLSTEIVGLIDAFTKKEGKLLDRIEAVVDIDFMIGDYLTVMDVLGINYNGTAWIKNEKEVYAPLNNVLKVNVKEFVNTLTGDKSAEEKRDYIIRIFDKLTVKDFVSLSDKLANLDKELLQKHIYPIVVADVIIDFITETDKLGVAKKYFGEITIGSIANLAINVTENGGVWSDGKGEMKLIVTDVFNITVNDILGIIETIKNGGDLEAIVKQVAEVVFNERSLKEYLADLKNDKVNKIIEKDALQKLITSKIVEVVAKVFEKIGEKDYTGIITYYFDETSVGEFAQIFMDGLKKDGDVWANNGKAVKLILSDVLDVNTDNIVAIVKAFKYIKDGINKTAEIILKRTFQAYVNDFGYDLSKKDAFAGIRDVVVSEFVAAMLENDRLDSLKNYFKDARLGDVVNVVNDKFAKNGDVWANNGKAVKLILSDVLDVNVDNIVEIVKSFKYIKDGINKTAEIILKRTFQAYVNDFGYDLSKKDAFAGIRDVVVSEFVAAMLENDRLDSLKNYFKDARLGDVVNVANDKFAKNGDVWSNNGKAVKLILSDVLDVDVDNIVEIVKAFQRAIKPGINKTAEIILKRTFQAYVKDFGYDLSKKDAFAGIRDVVVSEFVAAMLENDRLDSLKNYFKDARLGDVANVANDKFAKNGDVWANDGKAVKLILSDVLDVDVDNIVEIVKSFKYIKDGINKTAEIILKRTFQAYVKDFGYDLSKKDAFAGIRDVVVSDFVAEMLENDRLDSLKNYFKDARLGDVVNVANDKFAKNGDVWANDGKAVKLILSDILDVDVDNIVEIVKAFKNVKAGINKTAEIILKRTFQEYVKDFGYDLSKKEAFAGIRDVVVSEFVAAMLENDRLDSLKNYFKDARLGDVVNVANDKFAKNGDVWANNGKAVKLILSDVLDVDVDNIVEIVKAFKNVKAGVNKTAEIILKRTFQEYVKDFGYDLSKKEAFAGIRDVVVSEFVAAMLENDRLDSLKNYFKDARLGDVVNVANDKFAKNGDVWANNGKAVKLILSDVLDVDVDNIVEIVKAFKNVKAGVNKTAEIILKRTFQAYVKDFGYDLSKKDAFAGIRDVVVSDFVAAMLENDRLDSLKKYFGETRVGDIINLFEQSVEKAGDEAEKDGITTLAHSALKDGKRWQYKGKNFKLILSDLLDIEFNHVYNWIKVAKKGKVNATVETIVGDIFGENTFEDYTKDFGLKRISEKELFRPIRETKVIDFVTNLLEAKNMKARLKYLRTFVTGMKLGAIAEVADVGIESPKADGAKWTMKGKDIPYALSDILSLTFDDVLDLFFAREGETLPSWANRIVTLLNKYTLNDEHTLKLYIEDIVGKRLINKGVADLSDIRIAELVAVALKVKTGITVDDGGTLDKFNVTSQLPANFKDIIVYVCNITDKVLIGDYFTNLNNKEGGIYRNDDGVWYDKTTEVTGIRKTVYDLPTTYILGAIVLIAQPQLLLDAIKDYKIGKLIEKPYNNVMKSVDSEITNADGVYGVNGRFKELVESFVNITVEDVYNDIKGKKFVSNLREMFVNREVGDYLYDLGAWLAGKVTKRSVGLNGYAYEHVNEKGLYETDGNLQAVYGKIFNLNILTLIQQKKNIGKYLKAQFETLLLGDIFYDLGRVVTKGKLCEGYAFTNKAANEGKYRLVKSMGEVVSETFNISLKQIFDCIKGKQTLKNFKKLIKDTYGELTVGDFTYDLFRKYVAGKFKLTANGYASQFKADNTSLKGKGAKFFRATFVVKINDIIKFASDVRKNTGKKRNTVIIDFVSKVYGGLTLGDIFAPMIQKMSAKKLKMVYAYDDDYNVTVTGDFKEIANDVYSSTLKDLLAAIKGNKVKTYFVGRNDGSEDGLIGKHPAGDLLGYVFRDFMKKYFKNTDIEKDEEAGKWIAARSFSHPLNILFNDVKIAEFARIKDPKTFLLDNFGDVLVGELLGKYLDKGAWYKTDGTLEEINAENGGIIMKQVYEIKFSEIMDDNFNINYVIADIYVGELIGYYHCGLKYTKEDSLKARFNVCKDETHVDKNGYHIHEDECDVPLHDHSVGTNSYESGWYKNESGNIVPVTAIESVMADIRLGYMLGNSEVDFGEIFGDMTVGDVLGYEYCDRNNAEGAECTVTAAGHTHDARVGKTWYVKESTGVRRANALERTMANVKMKDIVNGSFNIDKELTSLKLGNLMNYEYCDDKNENDCYVDHATHAAGWYKQEGSEWTMIGEELYYDADDFKKFASASLDDYRGLGTNGAGWYHKTGSGKWEINNLGEAEQGEHIGNNLTLCILDYSMSGIRSDSFSKGLMDKVNKNVRVGDIFDPVTTSGPIKLISANTAIGNISGAISEAMKVATAGELMKYGMFPIETSIKDKMANVYGSTLALSWDYDNTCWKTKNGNAADDANDIVAATGTTAIGNAAMAAYKGDVPTSLTEALKNTAYITTIGEAYWKGLTVNQLVNVLLTRVQVS